MSETLHFLCPTIAGHHVEHLQGQRGVFVYAGGTNEDGASATQKEQQAEPEIQVINGIA